MSHHLVSNKRLRPIINQDISSIVEGAAIFCLVLNTVHEPNHFLRKLMKSDDLKLKILNSV